MEHWGERPDSSPCRGRDFQGFLEGKDILSILCWIEFSIVKVENNEKAA